MDLRWQPLLNTAVLQPIVRVLGKLCRTYLHQHTRDMAREVWHIQSTADAMDWVQRSSPDLMSGPFWLDVMLISSAVLILVSMTCCVARCFCWFCIDLPHAARELNDIREGKHDYQKQASKELTDSESRRNGEPKAKPMSAVDDLVLVSKMMRQHNASRKAAQSASNGESNRATAQQTDASPILSSPASSTISSGKGNANIQSHGSHATAKPAIVTTVVRAAASEFQPTRRTPRPVPCTATIRGFPQVNILTASAAQNFLLLNCRAKRKTVIYTQSNVSLLCQSGDAGGRAKKLELSGTAVEKAVSSAMRRESGVEVYAAAFTDDDNALVVGERNTDTFFVFTLRREHVCGGNSDSSAEVECAVLVSCVRQFKLPQRRLVSSLPPWRLLDSVGLLTFQQKDCVMELILFSSASVDSGQTAVSSTHKFKVGNALTWAQRGHDIAAAGSFMREVRLATLQPRSSSHITYQRTGANKSNHSSEMSGSGNEVYELTTRHVFLNSRKLRTLALCLVSPGQPSFNTRSYLIAFSEDGHGQVYDLSTLGSLSNTGEVVCSFTDTDFAGHDMQRPLRMTYAISGAAYKEKLTVALIRGADVTVFRQNSSIGSSDAHFTLTHVKDLYDVQDGNVVQEAVLIDGGSVLVTCGELGNGPARVFDLSK